MFRSFLLFVGGTMNIQQVMSTVDELKPNTIDEGIKLGWLQDVELTIYKEIILTHENNETYKKPNISIDTPYSTELIAEEPYARLYSEYLMSKIDFIQQEWTAYNNMSEQFNQSYKEYMAYYGRNHKHKQVRIKNYM